jgi:succinate dehydrogenase/fumarate reductase flavoprotein subunit
MTTNSSQFTGSIGTVAEKGIPDEADVVIVGSGGAGLMAALTAANEGARVLVVESRELVGGATGISAGAAWIPNHGFSTKELKVQDSLDQARRYIYGQGRDQVLDHDLVEAFLQTGPQVARYIEEHTAFGWIPTIWPDYRSDIDGASIGRALFPGPYSPHGLGEAARYVRPALTTGMAKNPLPFWLLGGMGVDQAWLAGPALVGALLEAGLRNGVDVRVEAPAVRLVTDGSAVRGVVVRADGAEHTVRATSGVLLASGGFESSTELTTTHLDGPFGVQVSPAGHDGIAVQLAHEVGADLTGMQDAWWMPGVQLPGEELEGRPLSRVFLGERALPHSIMVNSKGERFANEALAYDQFGAIMRQVDPETGTMPNATGVADLRPELLGQVRHLRHHPRRAGARLPPPSGHTHRPRPPDRRRRGRAAAHRRPVQPASPTSPRPAVPARRDPLRPLLRGLPPPARQPLARRAVPRRHGPDPTAHRRGDRADREQAGGTSSQAE